MQFACRQFVAAVWNVVDVHTHVRSELVGFRFPRSFEFVELDHYFQDGIEHVRYENQRQKEDKSANGGQRNSSKARRRTS